MIARSWFFVQGALAAAWWVAIFFHDGLRAATFGDADPRTWILPDLLLFVLPSLLAAWLAPGSLPLRIAIATLLAWTGVVLVAFGWRSLDGGRGAWGVIAMAFAFTGSFLAGSRLVFGPMSAARWFPSPLLIRPAAEASPARHLVRTLLQIVFFWGFFLGLLPWAIARLETRWNLRWTALSPDGFAIAGWILFSTMGILGLWAAAVMVIRGRGTPLPSETARDLVTTGPYAAVRNPMAVVGILQGVGIGLVHGSWLAVLYALTGSIVWNTLARPYEEADLLARFGDAYDDYRRRVRCWIPWPSAKLAEAERQTASRQGPTT